MHYAIPCYFHPATDPQGWEWVRTSSASFCVVNPHNGPGAGRDPHYTHLISEWDGPPLCGYVSVDYGRRDNQAVLADAATWQNSYSVSALMLDCFPVDGELSPWTQLIADLRGRGHDFIVANAGRSAPYEVIASADVTCTAEMDWRTYRQQRFTETPGDTWHIVHSVPPSQLLSARTLMMRNGATHGWATPHTLPHPYGWDDVLPSAL